VNRIEDRATYLATLDRANIDGDIGPFAELIADRVRGAMALASPMPKA
jgi:hypothetical protein